MTKPIVAAICGGSGSGKSTIVSMIKEQNPQANILIFSQDDYYRDLHYLDRKERESINYDHPDSIDHKLLEKHFCKLAQGQAIYRPQYDFTNHARANLGLRVESADIIFFDGIFSLYFPTLRHFFHTKIFVDVDDDLRFIRRLKRDIRSRGRTMENVISQYLETVRPMYRKFILPSREHANLCVSWENKEQSTIDLICKTLNIQ